MVFLPPLICSMLLPCKEVQKQAERTETSKLLIDNAVYMLPDNSTMLCLWFLTIFIQFYNKILSSRFRESNLTRL